jgi:hypothetical protein
MTTTVISFSGGQTSAYMAWWCKHNLPGPKAYVFANTGQEHEKTLEFVDRCDREWDLGVVWVEAVVTHGERVGSRARVVNFETASRKGEPFEEVIKKYGIPNVGVGPVCTRELKLNPMRDYLRTHYGNDYVSAVGIRVDEIDRMQADAKEKRVIYPLVSMNPTDKAKVNRFWQAQPWRLEIPNYLGNCVWCYKKSLRKHLTIMQDNPEFFDFPERMEKQYAYAGAGDGARVFFRESRSVADLKEMAKKPFQRWIEGQNLDLFSELDAHSGCQESCEVEL